MTSNDIEKKTSDLSDFCTALVTQSSNFTLGPTGGVICSLSAPLIKNSFNRVIMGLLKNICGYSEIARAIEASEHAIKMINSRLEQGETPREDDFFHNLSGRPYADEVLEGVVIKAKNEYEQRKARYLANIFVTGCFDSSFSREELNSHLKLAEQLTYNQLCILSVFGQKEVFKLSSQNMAGTAFGPHTGSMLREVMTLARRDLLELRYSDQLVGFPLRGVPDITPDQCRLTWEGERLFIAMRLVEIDRSDLAPIVNKLS